MSDYYDKQYSPLNNGENSPYTQSTPKQKKQVTQVKLPVFIPNENSAEELLSDILANLRSINKCFNPFPIDKSYLQAIETQCATAMQEANPEVYLLTKIHYELIKINNYLAELLKR